jgi:hypothetical protein
MTGVFRSALTAIAGAALAAFIAPSLAAGVKTAENRFVNPSFELGRDAWRIDKDGKTEVHFSLDSTDAAAGQYSALVAMGNAQGWGMQFGQTMEAGTQGKTYTFAVFAKSVKEPVTVQLQIECSGEPYGRVAASEELTIGPEAWKELHLTFTVAKAFPQGWFAYVSCTRPKAHFRLDMFRLVEGAYVPYEKIAREEAAAAAVKLFDTVSSSTTALSADALRKQPGWTRLPEDQTDHRFSGDAVLMNDRLALVLRQGQPEAELYAYGEQGLVCRARLAPLPLATGCRLESIAIGENSPSEVSVDAGFQSPGGKTLGLRFDLTLGQVFIKTEARPGTTGLAVRAACRFAVLPDFFADDIVVDAVGIPVATAELPSENFLLHMLPGGDAMVMSVASNRERDARISLLGQGPRRLIDRSEMDYGKNGKIWVASIEGHNVWHEHTVTKSESGKVVPLDWRAPFPAQWRVDWQFGNGLVSSWEMVSENRDGSFEKHALFGDPASIPPDRNRWNTVLGRFSYPCWIDREGSGYLQPLKRVLKFEGPALVYPIHRVKTTPLAEFTVVDLVRATLGVGPCEYILDVEGQGATMKGRATCATRDALGAIYTKHQQQQKQAQIEQILQDVVIFVTHIRSRIEEYAQFGRELLVYLDQQRQTHPEAAAFIDEMEALTRTIDAQYQERKPYIKTPQYVVDLTNKFRAEVLHDDGPDAFKKCTQITKAIVLVGGNQDELVGESRLAVKNLRQRAGLALATNPQAAEIAKEIRNRSQKVLRNASSYEAPRH